MQQTDEETKLIYKTIGRGHIRVIKLWYCVCLFIECGIFESKLKLCENADAMRTSTKSRIYLFFGSGKVLVIRLSTQFWVNNKLWIIQITNWTLSHLLILITEVQRMVSISRPETVMHYKSLSIGNTNESPTFVGGLIFATLL